MHQCCSERRVGGRPAMAPESIAVWLEEGHLNLIYLSAWTKREWNSTRPFNAWVYIYYIVSSDTSVEQAVRGTDMEFIEKKCVCA